MISLNNDTQVLSGWLDPMLRLLAERPDVGAVGAELLYPDGSSRKPAASSGAMPRAGTSDGRTCLQADVCHYVREVDYCSRPRP